MKKQGYLTTLAQKRIMADIKEFQNSDLNDKGIYISIPDDQINVIYSLIIGPPDTPYNNGFYFFSIKFPSDYPFSPPVVTFLTQDPEYKTRFHPNLYVKGKVCLSMLNTWDGPGWSAIQSLSSVLITIQSIMDAYPIRNEPSYEKLACDDPLMNDYNRSIEYQNLNIAILYYVRKTRLIESLSSFAPIVEKHFLRHYETNIDMLERFKRNYGSVNQYWIQVYQMETKTDYDYLQRSFLATRQELLARWPEYNLKQMVKLPKPITILKKRTT